MRRQRPDGARNRRAFLGALGASIVGLAGCSTGGGPAESGVTTTTTEGSDTTEETTTTGGTDTAEETTTKESTEEEPTETTAATSAGDERWTFASDQGSVYGISTANGRVFVSTDGNTLHALDPGTGDSLASAGVGGAKAPTVAGETVYVPGGKELAAFEANDALNERWRYEADGMTFRPAHVAGDAVYAMRWRDITSARTLYSFAADGGEENWEKRLAGEMAGDGERLHAATEDALYVGSRSRMTARSPEDGSELWDFDVPVAVRGVVVDDGTAFVGTGSLSSGKVYALDPADGEERWAVESSGPATPVADAERLYVGGNGIAVYDRSDRSESWSFDAGVAFIALGDGVLYANTRRETLRAFDAATGEELWATTPGVKLVGWPVPGDGAVYARDRDGVVHAFATG